MIAQFSRNVTILFCSNECVKLNKIQVVTDKTYHKGNLINDITVPSENDPHSMNYKNLLWFISFTIL